MELNKSDAFSNVQEVERRKKEEHGKSLSMLRQLRIAADFRA